MVYLESIQLVHRDLRAANVFVAEDGRVKVGDFGQSKMLSMPSSNPTGNFFITFLPRTMNMTCKCAVSKNILPQLIKQFQYTRICQIDQMGFVSSYIL